MPPARDAAADRPLVDTIVACCTAPGTAERAVVRLSGPSARAWVDGVVHVTDNPSPGRLGRGRIDLGDGVGVELLLLVFEAPRSLTGEDVVELHLPGWPVLVTELVRRLVAAGARPADRGEFTRRALVNGRMSLDQALAVGRLVAARDVEEAQSAAAVLSGHLTTLHAELREALLGALALIEAHVDFEEEDTEAVREQDVRRRLEQVAVLARRLLNAAETAPSRDGETDVVLLGPPNAGKSALFGALCPGACTTVSAMAGTTRDMLEARVVRAGRSFRLLDGPGVDPDHPALDELDRRAMDWFMERLPRAAVVLHVEDVTSPASGPSRQRRLSAAGERPAVAVWTQSDRLSGQPAPIDDMGTGRPPVTVSAQTGSGLESLWRAIESVAPAPRAPDLAGRLERDAAAAVLPGLEEAGRGDLGGALPVVSFELREALARLDGAGSAVTDLDEELLDRIFATFCVGK